MYWFYFPTWGGTDSRPWFWFLNLWSEHPWCCIRSKWWTGKCKLFFFLVTLGLPCSAQAFPYLWHVDSWGLLHRGISSPPGIKPVSPALEGRVLSTGPPGKSLGNVNFGWAVLKLLSPGSPIEYYDNLSPHLYPLTYTAEWVHQIRSDYNLFQTSPCPAFNDEFSPECWISGLSIYICWADLAFLNAWQWYFSHVLFLRSLLFFFFFVCATHSMWDLSSPASQGLNPSPLQWKRGVLTTGPLGRKSLFLSFVSLFLSCTSNYQSLPQPPPGVHFLQ